MILFYLVVLLLAVPKHPWFGLEVGGFTLAKYLGIMCFCYALMELMRSKRLTYLSSWPARYFLILVAWALASSIIVSEIPAFKLWPFHSYISSLTLFFVALTLVNSLRRLEYTTLALVGALGLASLYTLREYQRAGFGSERPLGWVAGDGNYFSVAALLMLPLAYQLMSFARTRQQRSFYKASLLGIFLAFVSTGSRGALAGLCAQFAFVAFRSKRKKQIVLACVLSVPVIIFLPASPIARLMRPTYSDTDSADKHVALWKFGIRMAAQHPLTGVGLGNFKRVSALSQITDRKDGYVAHNSYIEIGAELGIFGLLLYLGIVVSAFMLLERVRKRAQSLRHRFLLGLATGLEEGLVGFSVAAFFVSAEYEKPFWMVIFITAALSPIAQREFARIRNFRATREENKVHSFAIPEPMAGTSGGYAGILR